MKKLVLLVSLLIIFTSCAAKQRPVLIQGAMDEEVYVIVDSLKNMSVHHEAGWTFWQGKIDNITVVVSRTEIGLVNAAAATALGIKKFNPAIIINQGVAGGQIDTLNINDIVIAASALNVGAYYTPASSAGINPREWEHFTEVMRLRNADNATIDYPKGFSSNRYLHDTAILAGKEYTKGKVISGIIGSADEWNNEIERIHWLNEVYNTVAADMETSSAAQVAYAHDIPFIGIRVISDNSLNKQQYDKQVASNVQYFILNYIKLIDMNRFKLQ